MPTWAQTYEGWFLLVALAIGGWFAFRRHRRTAYLMSVGVLMALLFNLPFALVTKSEQYHFIGAGSVFALTAAVDALTRRTSVALRWVAAVCAVVAIVMMSKTSRDLAAFYAPHTELTLSRDDIVRTWAAVPDEIKQWLADKRINRASGDLALELPYAIFGAGAKERGADGRMFRWTAEHTSILINQSLRRADLSMRAMFFERPRRPFIVTIRVEGYQIGSITLADDVEQNVTIPLPRDTSNPRRMHLVEVFVDHTWTPGPSDPRRLGIVLYDPVFTRSNPESRTANPGAQPAPPSASPVLQDPRERAAAQFVERESAHLDRLGLGNGAGIQRAQKIIEKPLSRRRVVEHIADERGLCSFRDEIAEPLRGSGEALEEERVHRGVACRKLRGMEIPTLIEGANERVHDVIEVQFPRGVDRRAVLAPLGVGEK
jgi:hypothetical protein